MLKTVLERNDDILFDDVYASIKYAKNTIKLYLNHLLILMTLISSSKIKIMMCVKTVGLICIYNHT